MTTYKAANGAHFSDKDAQIIGQELERLNGQFTADDVVQIARAKRSNLHRFFTWDDETAAAEYRKEQARCLVRSVEIVIITARGQTNTRAFHSIAIGGKDGSYQSVYMPIEVVKASQDASDQVMARALGEAKSWQRRYEQYSDIFGGVFEAIGKVQIPEPSRTRAAI